MSTTFNTEAITELPTATEFQRANSAGNQDSDASRLWIARAVIVGVAAALARYTWGHWGDFQTDNGRELYVPAAILHGKLLFRDIWYMYGPLAPYFKALLFRIFGVQLTVLYVFGLILTIAAALLTFEIARRFRMGLVASMVPALFFLTESFYPFIRNFVFPYSYAASMATVMGLACLYFVMRHAAGAGTSNLGYAAVLASLAVLTKQEFGIACLALLAFEVLAGYWARRSLPETIRNSALCLAGLLPAVAGYGWFVWKLSARLIFFVNWISTPGTYFMRTFGKLTIPEQGLRFVPSELIESAEYALLCLAIWALFAGIAVYAIKKLGLKSRWSIAAWSISVLALLWIAAISAINPDWARSYLAVPMTQTIFPTGIFFIVVGFTIQALWKFVLSPNNVIFLQEAALGIYGALIAFRQMMELRPTVFYDCALFFNGPAFIVFVIVLYRIIRWACRSLDTRYQNLVPSTMLAAEAALFFLLFFPRPQLLPTKLSTDNGSFYTRTDVAAIFPQIISFMKQNTRNGKDILVLPEPPSLYVFAGMEAPSRWYSLVPGYVAPEQEQEYIDDLSSSHVRYVLIADRVLTEYGVKGFANGGYNLPIYQWIMTNYEKVGQFGPEPNAAFPPYVVWVYARKDLRPAIDPR